MNTEERYQLIIGEEVFELAMSAVDNLDLVSISKDSFHILDQDHRGHQISILGHDFQARQISLLINGNKYLVQIKRPIDSLVDRINQNTTSDKRAIHLKAPMPGLVLDIKVDAKQKVKKGDPLIILEAMKMENLIKSVSEGIVERIHVQKGSAVEKGQILIEIS